MSLDNDDMMKVLDVFMEKSTTRDPPSGYIICAHCYNFGKHKDDCIVPKAEKMRQDLAYIMTGEV